MVLNINAKRGKEDLAFPFHTDSYQNASLGISTLCHLSENQLVELQALGIRTTGPPANVVIV